MSYQDIQGMAFAMYRKGNELFHIKNEQSANKQLLATSTRKLKKL